ncbi:Pol polyprotein [Elysia marginata]|uniref:Pol polyprotein n=1 Tax=Elysia marginata TaxID=1093978 RepID=A0AAV4ELJ7_9GAST|nr:Pol polyprotein [Elysia marginata]
MGSRRLDMAGRDHSTENEIAGPFTIRIGPVTSEDHLNVADIKDDMLLGVDYLDKHGVEINFKDHTLKVRGIRLPLHSQSDQVQAKAYLEREIFVPAMSAVQARCVLESPLSGEILLSPERDPTILTPWTLCSGYDNVYSLVCDWSNRDVHLPRNFQIGMASTLSDYQPSPTTQTDYHKSSPCTRSCAPHPDHIKNLFEDSSAELNNEQCISDLVPLYIPSRCLRSSEKRMRRTPLHFRVEEDEHLDKMLCASVIKPSISEWASPPVLVRKRDGSVRWCVDYRALNTITGRMFFPLPRIEECVDALEGNVWFSKLDANSAYRQVRLDEESRPKTAFTTRRGLFEFVRMPFGLCNAPATFSRVINLVLSGMNWETVLAFLDDICILGRTYEYHMRNLKQVFKSFRQYGLRLNSKRSLQKTGKIFGPSG